MFHPDKDALIDDLCDSLESLRGRIVDVEAMVHAAAETIDRIPYLPRLSQPSTSDAKANWTIDNRRDLARLQALVVASSKGARALLDEIDDIIATFYAGSDPGGQSAPQPSAPAKSTSTPEATSGRPAPSKPSQTEPDGPSRDCTEDGPPSPSRAGTALDVRPIPPSVP